MSIETIIDELSRFSIMYANEGQEANFYSDNERLEKAQHNFEQIELAILALKQINH